MTWKSEVVESFLRMKWPFRSGKKTETAVKELIFSSNSTEAELCVASICGTEVRMLRAILLELGLPQKDPTLILIDNSALIHVMSDKKSFHRMKHKLLSYKAQILDRDGGRE
mmetsp:Transcript_34070/g.76701  ORF Transcript_34070/g.76701 Transcript_34070/m.76701 type:complete len:112 (-) Transcript_34070:99-434(-)